MPLDIRDDRHYAEPAQQTSAVRGNPAPHQIANVSGPIDITHEALSTADALASNVIDMVYELIGPEMESSSCGPERLMQDGRINALAYRAESVADNIRRANYALARLRNTL